ncbi:MAG: copper amine oxidase N-terminal domain-containing protein [Ruminococcaceae bacterium]|nr:copper amine oxidase N-terminal domain-containing protein [Oscillospiraceae bacterium]
MSVNGKTVPFDQPPVLENGRTLVPLRAIFEALGASVEWDAVAQTVRSVKGNNQISLQIGSATMYVNGTPKTLDVAAKIINGRTLVPVRAVSEAFGGKVEWDQYSQTVVIK